MATDKIALELLNMSSESKSILKSARTRFAPSPTGIMHIGGVRTALYDWLLARKTGGEFILRIEDTDRSRYMEKAEHSIMEALRWLGLDWDEGPDTGGKNGPYIQSQRLEIYHAVVRKLLASGHAYEDDTTPEELEKLRAQQKAARQPPGYDNRGRFRTEKDIEKSRSNGLPITVRMRVPDSEIVRINDIVRGILEFDLSKLQDFVILKSDGYPTYHLAHVVDDYEMEVSHVIRGEEWISSAPRHFLIHRALGWESPDYVHVPLILGKDRSKLSKRHGATSALEYRDKGFLPEAVLNFLALMGYSPADESEVMSIDEMIERFSLGRILQHPAIFDDEKLEWLNGVHIRRLSNDQLLERVIPILEQPESKNGLPDSVARPIDYIYLSKLLPLVHERLKTLNDIVDAVDFFFVEDVSLNLEELPGRKSDYEIAKNALEQSVALLNEIDLIKPNEVESKFRFLVDSLGLKAGQVFTPIRVAITGKRFAPPLFETIVGIGRDRTISRIAKAIDELNKVTM